MKKEIILLIARNMLIIFFEIILILIYTFDVAKSMWPLAAIIVNLICLFLLKILLKKENIEFSSIELKPFDTLLPFEKINKILNVVKAEPKLKSLLIDLGKFIVVFLIMGVPFVLLTQYLETNIPIIRDTQTIDALPQWIDIIILVFLPITQALVEFPWYYGYIYPRIEKIYENEKNNSKKAATTKAFIIVLISFMIQMAIMPIILDLEYILIKMLVMLPLLFIVGLITRLVPKYMPAINFLHFLMALSLSIQIWNLS